jgi:hypothetical protein
MQTPNLRRQIQNAHLRSAHIEQRVLYQSRFAQNLTLVINLMRIMDMHMNMCYDFWFQKGLSRLNPDLACFRYENCKSKWI